MRGHANYASLSRLDTYPGRSVNGGKQFTFEWRKSERESDDHFIHFLTLSCNVCVCVCVCVYLILTCLPLVRDDAPPSVCTDYLENVKKKGGDKEGKKPNRKKQGPSYV